MHAVWGPSAKVDGRGRIGHFSLLIFFLLIKTQLATFGTSWWGLELLKGYFIIVLNNLPHAVGEESGILLWMRKDLMIDQNYCSKIDPIQGIYEMIIVQDFFNCLRSVSIPSIKNSFLAKTSPSYFFSALTWKVVEWWTSWFSQKTLECFFFLEVTSWSNICWLFSISAQLWRNTTMGHN